LSRRREAQGCLGETRMGWGEYARPDDGGCDGNRGSGAHPATAECSRSADGHVRESDGSEGNTSAGEAARAPIGEVTAHGKSHPRCGLGIDKRESLNEVCGRAVSYMYRLKQPMPITLDGGLDQGSPLASFTLVISSRKDIEL
jgi:hypothetical protein